MSKAFLNTCFTCQHRVHEFEDNKYGCDHCHAVWVYFDPSTAKEGGWKNITKKTEIENQNGNGSKGRKTTRSGGDEERNRDSGEGDQ